MDKILVTSREYGTESASLISDFLKPTGIELIKLDRTGPMGEDELVRALPGYSAVISYSSMDRFSSRVIESLSGLKIIARHGVGYETIDVECARRRGVYVCTTVEGAHEERAVADLTMSLLLALLRRVVLLNGVVKAGRWERPLGKDLWGKTLGIIGLGKIGRAVALRAAGFGLNIVAHDTVVDGEFASRQGVKYVSLAELLASSDYVTLHAPMTPRTRKMLGRAEVFAMKRGAYLINCARAGLVDQVALHEALRSGHLAGAAVDVYDTEPPSGDPLLEMENVITVPHVGAYTEDTIHAMDMLVLGMCVDVLQGRRPGNVINGL